MSRKNRFGFESVSDIPVGVVPRRRGSGPMATAVRETAETLAESTEAKVETRKQNAADARDYREALADGRVLLRVPLDQIGTDDLPRDRLDLDGVAAADEMDELKASIRAHGQKEPIELYRIDDRLQLKKGWRRVTALRALYQETGDDRFATALARVDGGVNDRLRHYVDMVEENILRQDLTYAEMAEVALKAASDPQAESGTPEDMVGRLYASLHKMKRSHIRSFVAVLAALGEDLPFPKAVPRDLGLDIARALKERPRITGQLRRDLVVCADAEEQNAVLRQAVRPDRGRAAQPGKKDARRKFEFHIGSSKVTARRGEFRIKDDIDFSTVERERLQAAVLAFKKVLDGDG